MEFEWDETKTRANLDKHGLDFLAALAIFQTEPVLEVRAAREGEERWKAIGVVEGVMLAVVYTWREGRRCIISARRANRNESRTYHETLAGGSDEG